MPSIADMKDLVKDKITTFLNENNCSLLRGEDVFLDSMKIWSDFSVEIYDPQKEVAINLEVRSSSTWKTNPNGDEVAEITHQVHITSPFKSRMNCHEAQRIFSFWLKVAKLAENIDAEISNVVYEEILETAKSVAIREKYRAERRSDIAYQEACMITCKGLRVGGLGKWVNATDQMLPFEGTKTMPLRKGKYMYFYKLVREQENLDFKSFIIYLTHKEQIVLTYVVVGRNIA